MFDSIVGRDFTTGEELDVSTLRTAQDILRYAKHRIDRLPTIAPPARCDTLEDTSAALGELIENLEATSDAYSSRAETYDKREAEIDALNSERDMWR
jgi:hypothetical protein